MNNYLTERRSVTGTISIFAYPNTSFDPNDPESEAFYYELSEGKTHWRSNAICVHTQDVTLTCPRGVNLVAEAITTLREKIKEKQARLHDDIMELEEQISKLQMIPYMPEAEIVSGYDGEPDIEVINQ